MASRGSQTAAAAASMAAPRTSLPTLLVLRLFLVLLALTTPAAALSRITIASTVQADKDTAVHVVNDASSSSGTTFTGFNVYLSVSPPGWGRNAVCLLVNGSSIGTTDLTVRIPASVGPVASNYTLVVTRLNDNPNAYPGAFGFQYGSDFTLEGATGVWSAYETQPSSPRSLGDENLIPCSAYDCARQCDQKFYPQDADEANEEAYKNAYECIAKCPGVTYPDYEALADGAGNGTVSALGGGTGGGAATATSGTAATRASVTGTTSASAKSGAATTTTVPAASGSATPAAGSTVPSQAAGAPDGAPLSTAALAIALLVGVMLG